LIDNNGEGHPPPSKLRFQPLTVNKQVQKEPQNSLSVHHVHLINCCTSNSINQCLPFSLSSLL